MPRIRPCHATVFGLTALLATLAAAQAPAPAPAAPLPPAKKVLDRFVEVTGGRAAYEKAKHKTVTGTMEIANMGLRGKFQLQQSAPDKLSMRLELPGVGTIVKATDGAHAWEVSAITGPRLLEGSERTEALLEAAFDAELRPESIYSKMETVRVEDVDGKPAYVLELTPRIGGPPRSYFYDKQSGLLVKFVATATSPMGEVKAESTVADYRPEAGVLVPHKLTLAAMGMQQIMTFETFAATPVPAEAYAMPAEVKALLPQPPAK